MTHKIDIPEDIYNRAMAAAEAAGLSPDSFLLEAILAAVEDFEDLRDAEAAIARIENGENAIYSLEDLEMMIGVDNRNLGTGKKAISKAS